MADFVSVPADVLESFLQNLHFERKIQGKEIVYVRRSARNNAVVMKIYTSIGSGNASVRPAGRDSLKVCVVFDDGYRSFGIGRFPPVMRVHSIQSVLDRTWDRIQAATVRAKQWMDQQDGQSQAQDCAAQ